MNTDAGGGRRLAGKVAIITGASSGVGEAIGRKMAARGASVKAGLRKKAVLF